MKSIKLQRSLDKIIDKVFLWAIPHWLKPNFFSYLRIALVPFIFWLLYVGQNHLALIMFIIAACTDFIDGALARTRDQITDLGKLLDPIADKMLILVVLVYIGFDHLIVWVFTIVITFEIVGVLASALFARYLGRPIGANFFGKVKMVFQSFAVGLFLIGIIINNESVVKFSEVLLIIALFFAFISMLQHIQHKIKKYLKK
jgi:CDP-diacylglycerol--glycerol-3-phosphate 3-phosphatidyltransferase